MKALYNIYIVPDVYYCNKYEIIVYTHIIQCSQCHNYNVLVVPHAHGGVFDFVYIGDFTIRLITETFSLT